MQKPGKNPTLEIA